MGVLVLERSDRDGNGRCVYDRDEHGCGKYDCGSNGRDGHVREENDHSVNGRLHAGDLYENDLSGHARHVSAHAHDARGRRRSCQ